VSLSDQPHVSLSDQASAVVPTDDDVVWACGVVAWFRQTHALGVPIAGLGSQMNGDLLRRWLLARIVLLVGHVPTTLP
jgi:hypothetical protein